MTMSISRWNSLACAGAALLAVALLGGCGDKKSHPAAKRDAPKTSSEPQAVELPSIAGKLARYQLVDFGREVDRAGFFAYHDMFMRSAAAASNFDRAKFAEMAFIEVGSENDAFKREDAAKGYQAKVDELAKSPIKFLRIADSAKEGGLYTGVEPYDMDAETYEIHFKLKDLAYAYRWSEKQREYVYRYELSAPSIRAVRTCMECSDDVTVLLKMPKDRAREVEAKLAPLRISGRSAAAIRAEYFVSVDKIVTAQWDRADVGVNIDAVALRLPGQKDGDPVIFIDGPDFKRK
jgi:hypothetical protein